MKKLTLGLILLLGTVFVTSFSFIHSSEDQIIGEWLTGNKKAKIKIFKKNDLYYGIISWMVEPLKDGKPKVDSNNPDASKRNQPLMGNRNPM